MKFCYYALSLLLVLLFSNVLLAEDQVDNNNNEIKFGIMAPLTGDYASAGLDIQRGADIAVSELKESDINVKLILENACLPAEGVSSIKKLITSDKIDALVSNYCLITLNAILPIVNEYKLITFQNSVSPLELFKQTSYMYATWPAIEEEVQSMINSFSKEELERPAILYLESPWGIAYQKAFEKQLKDKNINLVLSRSQGFGFHDFRTEVAKLKSANTSVVFVGHTGSNLISFFKTIYLYLL
jgi:branched-chain amino acid transport system substrate-binding protein